MKYKVLKEFVDTRVRELMKPGNITTFLYEDDAGSYRNLLIQYGFIEEIKDESWKPKEGKTDYYITADGSVATCCYMSKDELPYALRRNEIGNSFPTREERDKAREWLKAFKVLRDDMKGFKPDWKNHHHYGVNIYSVWYEHSTGELKTGWNNHAQDNIIHFATKSDAKESSKKHKKEWLTFYGVEETE